MTASTTSTPSLQALRCGWETYAHQVISEIHQMSPEERAESRDLVLRRIPMTELPKYSDRFLREVTVKEVELRAALQLGYFDPFSADVLQSHFTYFYQKHRVIKMLKELAPTFHDSNNEKERIAVREEAVSLIVNEIGKSLLRKGIQPQIT